MQLGAGDPVLLLLLMMVLMALLLMLLMVLLVVLLVVLFLLLLVVLLYLMVLMVLLLLLCPVRPCSQRCSGHPHRGAGCRLAEACRSRRGTMASTLVCCVSHRPRPSALLLSFLWARLHFFCAAR